METILYFALWAGLFFLMMRFGCGAHVLGHGDGKGAGNHGSKSGADATQLRWSAPATDIDPVCIKSVKTATAKPSIHDGQVYYFCSRECRERFEAAPDTYLAAFNDKIDNEKEQAHV